PTAQPHSSPRPRNRAHDGGGSGDRARGAAAARRPPDAREQDRGHHRTNGPERPDGLHHDRGPLPQSARPGRPDVPVERGHAMTGALYFEDVAEGDALPQLMKRPTALAIFRYSAVTWNSHRIHYDTAWARKEGYPDVLVQAHMHGAYLTQLVMDWIGPSGI